MTIKFLIMVCIFSSIVVVNSIDQGRLGKAKGHRRIRKVCDSKMTIHGCDVEEGVTISRRKQHKFRANYIPDPTCNITDSEFDWALRMANGTSVDYNDYYNKDIFIVEPFMIGTGNNYIYVTVYEFDANENKATKSSTFGICRLTIEAEQPIAKITGGEEVTVVSGEEYRVSGEESVDMNVPPGQPGNLQFKWSCTAKGLTTDFCDEDLGDDRFLIIPWHEAVSGATFTITLSVRADGSSWESTKQKVNFKSGVHPVVEIKCLKNCQPLVRKTNKENPVTLEIVCVQNCKTKKTYIYDWHIVPELPNFDEDTYISEDTKMFEIYENVLDYGEKYTVEVLIRGTSEPMKIEIVVNYPPILESCDVRPRSGVALVTKFIVHCKYDPGPGNHTFEIFSWQSDIYILLIRGTRLEAMPFSLSAGSELAVRIIDEDQFYDQLGVDVTVTTLLTSTGTTQDIEKEILDVYFDDKSDLSITKLLEAKDFDRAFQVANSLADEMGKLKLDGKEAIATKYYKEILDLMEKMPLDTEDQALQKGALAAKIASAFELNSDPDIAAQATNICVKSVGKMLNEMEKKEFPGSYVAQTKNNLHVVSKCARATMGMNLDALHPDIPIPKVTTPSPLIDTEDHSENYPEYEDDQKSSKAMSKFDTSVYSTLELCYMASKQMALGLSTQDNTLFIDSDFFNLTSTVKLPRDILYTEVESHGITLVPSYDFTSGNSEIHIAMCTSTENIFWWNRDVQLFTSIAIIQFNVNKKPVSTFNKPFELSFETSKYKTMSLDIHKAVTPKIPDSKLSKTEGDFEKISMHRIETYKRQSFFVEFVDVPTNVILKVLITNLYKPSLEEFQEKSVRISQNDNKIFTSHDNNYDSWYYLAVLPSRYYPMTTAVITPYKFMVYTLVCLRWMVKESNWTVGCGSHRDSSPNFIICECYHSSAIAPMQYNNQVRVEKTLTEELELETEACYIILISVAVAFFLYCIFLVWFSIAAVDEVLEETIFFLSDVPLSHRYGYVLIVKTGNKSKAGTTSNVMIKMYGSKSESSPHVLNYPDPEKQLMQQNEENWFFLATESYLGDIEKIELWSDFIGFSPAWFCSEVEIFDIQQNKHWVIPVNTWFDVLTNEEMTCTSYPVKPEAIKKKKTIVTNMLKKLFNSFRGAHMWNLISREEQAITRMKRLHVILSIFLTAYATGLFFYGCPKFEPADSLVYTSHYGIDKYVVLYTLGCFLITFAIHFPIVWFLRYPKENIFSKSKKMSSKYSISSDSLCWFFLTIIILTSMTLLIIMGFWVPHIIGLLWLTSVLVSLLVYIFIMENIMRVIINFTTNQQTKVKNIFDQIKRSLAIVENQRVLLYKTFGPAVLRPFFSHLYKPLDKLKLKEHRLWAERRERLWELVEDLIMITIYVTMLYLVILMDKDKMIYPSHVEVKELITGTHSRTFSLENVFHRKEIGKYLNNTLISSMQSLQWYGKYVAKNPGTTMDKTNKYLGIARLRQHRTYSVPCKDNISQQTTCFPTYFWYHEYQNFSELWKSDTLSNKFSRMNPVWNYVSDQKAGTLKYMGTFALYPGGGYIATLGRTMQNSLVNLNYILRNGWIDHLTRSIFVEFLLYNVCNNLFSSVQIAFEIYPTGYIEKKLSVHTARLLFIKEETGLMLWIILISFLVVLTILIMKFATKIIRKKKLLLKDVWHIADVFIILISLTCLGLYVARSDVVRVFLADVEKAKNNEFVNYFHLMYTEQVLTIIAAILVFLATLRLWKLMRFMTFVRVVEKTIILSAPVLLGFFLYQMVFMFASTFYTVLMYGDKDYDFRTIPDAMTNLFITSLNLYTEEFDFKVLNNTMGYLFYAVFMLFSLSIYTLYIAVITLHYAQAQFYYSNEEEYSMFDFLKERGQYYKELVKMKWDTFRMRGGTEGVEIDRKVLPKDDEFRYADCITLPSNKMDGMIFVTKCILRNMRTNRKMRMTDKDVDLIKHTVANLFCEQDTEEKEIFFTANVEGDKVKIVDDRVLLKIERVVEAFLSPDEGRAERLKRRQLVKKIVDSHKQKMNDIVDNLNVLLNVLSDVNIGK